jgi:uncharacterized membrane protein
MTTNITFLVIGQILLSIGILGYFTNNLYLAYICVALSVAFFIRQLFALRPIKTPEITEAPTITI